MPSISQLQFMVMEHDKLIERHARRLGLGEIKASWPIFSGGAAMNDALLSGELQVGATGVPPFLIIWAKTVGTYDVMGVSSIVSGPIYLNTRDANLKTLKDLSARNKIAMPAAKGSNQAIVLQMAAAQLFGDANYSRFDSLTTSLPNPDGMAALLSEQTEIDCHFTAPPYQYLELKNPKIRTLLNSHTIFGGPTTLSMVYAARKFRDENPMLYKAFIAAMDEATAIIYRDKTAAAGIYLEISKDKRSTTDDILKILNDPQVTYTLTPQNLMKYAEFMHKVGTLPRVPRSWKEMFFPEVHDLPG